MNKAGWPAARRVVGGRHVSPIPMEGERRGGCDATALSPEAHADFAGRTVCRAQEQAGSNGTTGTDDLDASPALRLTIPSFA